MHRPWLNQYPEGVPGSWTPHPRTLPEQFLEQVRRQPEDIALYYFETAITYSELNRLAGRLARALRELGAGPGARVGLLLQNVPAFVVAQLAVWQIGGIVVPLSIMTTAHELPFYLMDADIRVVLVMASRLPEVGDVLRERVTTIIAVDDGLDLGEAPGPPWISRDAVVPPYALPYAEIVKNPEGFTQWAPLMGDDVAYLHYTSGTTGVPKGAMNTHANVVHSTRVYTEWCRLGPGDVDIVFAPAFHITGSIAGLATALWAGIPMVLLYRFDTDLALNAIERHRATFTVGAITTYLSLLKHGDLSCRDLSSFQKAYSGGAPVPAAVVDRFRAATGQQIYNVYGLTESTSPATMMPWGKPTPSDPDTGVLSVGVPVPGLDVRLVSLEERSQDAAPGSAGELALSGPMMVPGYWGRPDETATSMADGWFYTGDVATMDADGYVYVVDRKKDMIIASGYKVWPREVEEVLSHHPAVREAAVIGIPDNYRGETVKAFVALKESVTLEALTAYCRERLAAYKVPRELEIVETLPKTITGKVLRRALRTTEDKATQGELET